MFVIDDDVGVVVVVVVLNILVELLLVRNG
jgi:hypothetical protein